VTDGQLRIVPGAKVQIKESADTTPQRIPESPTEPSKKETAKD
jgi:hypothetical protein